MARTDARAPLSAHQHARGALPVRTVPTETEPARRFEPLPLEARRVFVERVLRPRP